MEEIEIGSDVYLNSAEIIISLLTTLGVVGAAALSVQEVRDAIKKYGKGAFNYLKNKLNLKAQAKPEMEEQLNELRNEIMVFIKKNSLEG